MTKPGLQDSLFGPDGTSDPAPGRSFVDPLAGLAGGTEWFSQPEAPRGGGAQVELAEQREVRETVENMLAEQRERAKEQVEQSGPALPSARSIAASQSAAGRQAAEQRPAPATQQAPVRQPAPQQRQQAPARSTGRQRSQQGQQQNQARQNGMRGCLVPLLIFLVILAFSFFDKIKDLFQ